MTDDTTPDAADTPEPAPDSAAADALAANAPLVAVLMEIERHVADGRAGTSRRGCSRSVRTDVRIDWPSAEPGPSPTACGAPTDEPNPVEALTADRAGRLPARRWT